MVIVAVIAVFLLLPGTAIARSCKDVTYVIHGNVYAQTYELKASNTGCRLARRVASEWLRTAEGVENTPRPLGFSCRSSSDIVQTCRRGRRVVRWLTENRFEARAEPASDCDVEDVAECPGERSCGKVTSRNPSVGSVRLRVWAKGYGCGAARAVARQISGRPTPSGWSCLGTDIAGTCHRGSANKSIDAILRGKHTRHREA